MALQTGDPAGPRIFDLQSSRFGLEKHPLKRYFAGTGLRRALF